MVIPSTAWRGLELRLGRYSAAYRRQLLQASEHLEAYLAQCHLSLSHAARRPRQLDEILSAYVVENHRTGGHNALRMCKHAVLAVQVLIPSAKSQLPQTWSILRSWEESYEGQMRIPIPVSLMLAIVAYARCWRLAGGSFAPAMVGVQCSGGGCVLLFAATWRALQTSL